MRLAVFFSGALLGLLAGKEEGDRGGGPWEEACPGLLTSLLLKAQGTGNDCPHKKSATLLPSFTVTPTATESTSSPRPTSHRTTKSHRTTTQRPITTTRHTTNTTGTTSRESPTATHSPATTTSHQNTTVHPTRNSTATSPGPSTRSPHPEPPPSPIPSPGSKEAIGDYIWNNGSQPCVRLQAQIQMRVLYPTQGGGEVKTVKTVEDIKGRGQRSDSIQKGVRKSRGGDKYRLKTKGTWNGRAM